MNATDLRIGNIVYFDSEMAIGKYVKIGSIESDGVRVFNGIESDKGKNLTKIIPFEKIEII